MTNQSKSDSDSVRKPLTAERLREVIHYDPGTGAFTWIGPAKRRARRVPGNRLGYPMQQHGYLETRVEGRRYLLHRLAWLYMTGKWPQAEVDHVNHIRSDNRWANLRAASRRQNAANISRSARNTSGVKGVWFDRERHKWTAMIGGHETRRPLGRFATKEEAVAARNRAAFERYGEFANPD